MAERSPRSTSSGYNASTSTPSTKRWGQPRQVKVASPSSGTESVQAGPYQFGPYILDLRAGTLTREGVSVKLPPKPFTLLGYLVERPAELVTREQLRVALWGESTFVDAEEGIAFCLRQLRQALGDQPSSPTYVETVRGRGVRFVHPVVDLGAARNRRASDRAPGVDAGSDSRAWQPRSTRDRRQGDRRRGRPTRWRLAGAALVGLALVALALTLVTIACPARPVPVGDQAVAGPRSTAI